MLLLTVSLSRHGSDDFPSNLTAGDTRSMLRGRSLSKDKKEFMFIISTNHPKKILAPKRLLALLEGQ